MVIGVQSTPYSYTLIWITRSEYGKGSECLSASIHIPTYTVHIGVIWNLAITKNCRIYVCSIVQTICKHCPALLMLTFLIFIVKGLFNKIKILYKRRAINLNITIPTLVFMGDSPFN